MLSVIPVLAYMGIFLVLLNMDRDHSWRRSFVRALALWGAWLVLSAEFLSLMHAITQAGLALAWVIPLVACLVRLSVYSRSGRLVWRPPLVWLQKATHWVQVGIIGIVIMITALVAWVSPPNTADSLNYHMPRVAHWAENRTLAHYPTGIEQQNSRPIVAELAVLNFYVLSNSDRLSNFVEWFAMLGSVIGVSLLAELLGAGLIGQLFAAVFAVTLPMGIVQASSTMTDYVVTLWLVCVAIEVLNLWRGEDSVPSVIGYMGLSAGLSLATKATAAVYLMPFALVAPFLLARKAGILQFLRGVVLVIALCVILNAGPLIRNQLTYHSLVDPDQTEIHLNEMRNWKGLVSNMLRNAGMQVSTPWPEVNLQINRLIWGIHVKIDLDVNDPRTTAHGEFWVRPISTYEDFSPNPLHAWLILSFAVLSILRPKTIGRLGLVYQLMLIMGFALFSFLFKWQVFGSRYLLPLFVLYAPIAGVIFSKFLPRICSLPLSILLLACSSIWLVGIQERPIIPLPGMDTPSIFKQPRAQLYFTTAPALYTPIEQVAGLIESSGCRDIGLALSGTANEYLWWITLDPPGNANRIEWLVGGQSILQHPRDYFVPCAVIADRRLQAAPPGLALAALLEGFYLYLPTNP